MVLPSAFQFIEGPSRSLFDRLSTRPVDFDNTGRDAPTLQDCKYYLGGMVLYPLILCATPLTILSDIVTGIFETGVSLYRGHGLRAAGQVAKKKMIVSPLHQLTFLAANLGASAMGICFLIRRTSLSLGIKPDRFDLIFAAAGFLYFQSFPMVRNYTHFQFLRRMPNRLRSLFTNQTIFLITNIAFIALASRDIQKLDKRVGGLMLALPSLFWVPLYIFSQRLIGNLPSFLNHRVFSIFKNGGAKDKDGCSYQDLGTEETYEAWEAEFENYSRTRSTTLGISPTPIKIFEIRDPRVNCWRVFLKDDYLKIQPSTEGENDLYREFKAGILAGKLPAELLHISSRPTQDAVLRAFRKCARAVHSDHNAVRFEESQQLFKCLCEARIALTQST
jgi:hypothetical protein